ncbi:hypothetical protein BH11MYX3_BH11MYX3_03870 [soil metagenome]
MSRPGIVAAAVALLCGVAHAEDKSTIAVIGVQGRDALADKVADGLTLALRKQASAKTGVYRALGSRKDLMGALRRAECRALEPVCSTTIGTDLGADFVLTGELETRSKRYTLVLSLVSVKTRQRIRSLRETVATSVDVKRWARTTYARLVDSATGELAIAANAQRGDILFDGQVIAALFNGRALITNIALGSHQISFRAAGYRPLDVEITIDGSMKQTFLLEPLE